jgi:hypothetical protein
MNLVSLNANFNYLSPCPPTFGDPTFLINLCSYYAYLDKLFSLDPTITILNPICKNTTVNDPPNDP